MYIIIIIRSQLRLHESSFSFYSMFFHERSEGMKIPGADLGGGCRRSAYTTGILQKKKLCDLLVLK